MKIACQVKQKTRCATKSLKHLPFRGELLESRDPQWLKQAKLKGSKIVAHRVQKSNSLED